MSYSVSEREMALLNAARLALFDLPDWVDSVKPLVEAIANYSEFLDKPAVHPHRAKEVNAP